MKVLLANKFYYRRGGDCVCTLNLEQLLKDHNHDTAVFAMQHPENFPTPWSKYFPVSYTHLDVYKRQIGKNCSTT